MPSSLFCSFSTPYQTDFSLELLGPATVDWRKVTFKDSFVCIIDEN